MSIEQRVSDNSLSVVLKFPAGIDNRSREYALAEGTARTIENMDVTRDGGLISRKGTRLVLAENSHSLFTPPHQRFMLAVLAGDLVRVSSDEGHEILVTGVGPTVYVMLNDEVFWSDGSKTGRVLADGSPGPWGLNAPPSPQVSVVATGALSAGVYQVAMTAIHPTGIESGCTETVDVEVPEGGGIQITTPTATGVRFALYRTSVHGSHQELRRALLVDPATTVLIGNQLLGKPLESLFAVKPLAGQCLASYKGRLWVATGNAVWFTSDRSPHWLFPRTGFYQFESTVTMLGAAENGLYVGLHDRVYFLQGNDPNDMTQRPVASVGAATGGGGDISYDVFVGQNNFPSRRCMFYDVDGYVCIGTSGGVVIRPTQAMFTTGKTQQATLAYREHQGLRQIISTVARIDSPLAVDITPLYEVFANGVALGG